MRTLAASSRTRTQHARAAWVGGELNSLMSTGSISRRVNLDRWEMLKKSKPRSPFCDHAHMYIMPDSRPLFFTICSVIMDFHPSL